MRYPTSPESGAFPLPRKRSCRSLCFSLVSRSIFYVLSLLGLCIDVFIAGYIFGKHFAQNILLSRTVFLNLSTGPLIWAPLSEQYGRRWLSIGTFVMFCIWTMACGLAPTWAAFLVFRLFVGIFASGPIAIVTGILADIYNGHRARGRAMAAFMAVRRPFNA